MSINRYYQIIKLRIIAPEITITDPDNTTRTGRHACAIERIAVIQYKIRKNERIIELCEGKRAVELVVAERKLRNRQLAEEMCSLEQILKLEEAMFYKGQRREQMKDRIRAWLKRISGMV